MTRTSIMLPEELKRQAIAEARKLNISFADFVRQAIAKRLPGTRSSDRLKSRRSDPIFRVFTDLGPVKAKTRADISLNHDDYLYRRKMTSVFIDTGAFVSRVLPRDQFHRASKRAWETLTEVPVKLFTTEHIFDEAISLLARHQEGQYAARWARQHLASTELQWLPTTREDWHEALRLLEKFSDQKLSATDALSFTVMRREGIETVFGFDKHFQLAGFELWP